VQNINLPLQELADLFINKQYGDDEIIHPEVLGRTKLNYSMESLKEVDNYLGYAHEQFPQQMTRQWFRSILRTGAYVGEVIRRNAIRTFDWVDFDLFVQEFPRTRQLLGDQKTLGCCALLTVGSGQFTLPINKVIKFIHNGNEDSVWFYASAEAQREE
jgi:hypothetical protein